MSGFGTMYQVFVGRKNKNTNPRTSAEGLAAQVFLRTHGFCLVLLGGENKITDPRTSAEGLAAQIFLRTHEFCLVLLGGKKTQLLTRALPRKDWRHKFSYARMSFAPGSLQNSGFAPAP